MKDLKNFIEENDISPMKFEKYDLVANSPNKGKNLVMFLYFCEEPMAVVLKVLSLNQISGIYLNNLL